MRVVFQHPFRTLDRPTTDCSRNWYNRALMQHIVFKSLAPCDYFLHVYLKYRIMLSKGGKRMDGTNFKASSLT